jgi:hypothetical protein
MPANPFILRPRGGSQGVEPVAPGAVQPWVPRRVEQPARIEERAAPAPAPQPPQRAVPTQSNAPLSQPHWSAPSPAAARSVESNPQRVPENADQPGERRQLAPAARRVAPAVPDPLKERPKGRVEKSEEKH